MASDNENLKHKETAKIHYVEPIEGHNYDGIGELDNPPPRWIMWLFYLTIAWSIFYGAYYFWLGIGKNQDQEYAAKSAQHDEQFKKPATPAAELKLLTDDAALTGGKELFTSQGCIACHGMNGEGNPIGPNLTDEYWINGCSFDKVVTMIKNGNPAKGMTPFKDKISEEKIAQLASYVLVKLKDSKPANAKAPQGDKCAN